MKVGDRVKILAGHYSDGTNWLEALGKAGTIIALYPPNLIGGYDWYVKIDERERDAAFSTYELEVIADSPAKVRRFESGATRDESESKLSYVNALSPIALQRYVEYIGKHRCQVDGNLRNWDNWKAGIPKDVYLDSLGRHFWAVWMIIQGFDVSDNHGPATLQDSLCGIIFNAMGILHEEEKERLSGLIDKVFD